MRIGLSIVSGLFLLLGAAMIVGASGFSDSSMTLGAPGPGRMPTVCGWAIVVLSALILVRVLCQGPTKPLAFPQLPRVAVMAAAGVLYVVVLPVLGYYVATPLFLAPVLLLLRASRVTAVAVAAGFVGFIFVVFDKLLGVPLP
ncbi:tripartite tricarboxylate transporter TctB family protein [Shumkonia mesophila]|uniref:tripartite tricarboxylate transporter TctB family protein n=1 Tax=Shumkonia mesophila TaxID=2838854 RepID=UPI0029341E69|nr:tripartite tricarboxylate transporter TctB family protein [Shumkonia mesophila]